MPSLFRPQNEPGVRVFESSFIQLTHPGGKIWQSLFIPRTKMGALGVVITRWGKNDKVNGQAQVKEMSIAQWENLAFNKTRNGGYDPILYVGDQSDLKIMNSGFTSCECFPSFNLTADDLQRVTGFTVNGLDEKVAKSVFEEMAIGYMEFQPIREFLVHIQTKTQANLGELPTPYLPGFSAKLGRLLVKSDDDPIGIMTFKPKPPRDLAQEYESWGVFS